MTHMSEPGPVIALVRDLLFASKITATAAAAGTSVMLVRDPAKLVGVRGSRLIVDLNLAGAIEAAQAWKAQTGGEAVGFVSHVDTATVDRARAAGVDRVLARSRFVELLAELVVAAQS
jgi:ABC-type sugar transport system substrate-binding protein